MRSGKLNKRLSRVQPLNTSKAIILLLGSEGGATYIYSLLAYTINMTSSDKISLTLPFQRGRSVWSSFLWKMLKQNEASHIT